MFSMDATRSNHTVYNINYHFVWCPRYRHSFLDRVAETLESEFHAIIQRNDYEFRSLHISPDHVHVFLGAHPKWFERLRLSSSREYSILERHAPSEIVSRLKSVTARKLWSDHPEVMRSLYWGGGCWERSFYVGTAGEVSRETIDQYINRSEHV